MPLFIGLNKSDVDSKLYESNASLIYKNGNLKSISSNCKNHKSIDILLKLGYGGLVLFSSGSTGKPKAILHNLDNLLDSYLDKKNKNINILLFLMFDHIGGLNTLFNALAIGASGIAIQDRKNIEKIVESICKYQISMLPASPSFLNLLLLSGVLLKFDVSSLKIITYGTEKMPTALLDRLKKSMPRVRFHQTLGTSEVGILQTKSYQNSIKLEGVDYKILNNRLYLKSKTQALGYLNVDDHSFDEDGYFDSGDMVETEVINGEEYIRILGRAKEVINVGGEKVLPQEIEGVIMQIDEIQDCLVYGESNAITGQKVSVKVVLESGKNLSNIELKQKIRNFCKDKLDRYKIPTKVEIVSNLNITNRYKKERL